MKCENLSFQTLKYRIIQTFEPRQKWESESKSEARLWKTSITWPGLASGKGLKICYRKLMYQNIFTRAQIQPKVKDTMIQNYMKFIFSWSPNNFMNNGNIQFKLKTRH